VLVDDYNPTEHKISAEQVLGYLRAEGMLPQYWAYEKDLLGNAQLLLDSLTSSKLKNNYVKYIAKHEKYPCSLLTASWYLTRLGQLDPAGIIHSVDENPVYKPAQRLLNLLPEDYRPIEERARKLILSSKFAAHADKIQDLFYPLDSERARNLF
jgi:hypothetical protein